MQRLNTARVADILSSRLPNVVASVVDHKLVTPQIAQIVVEFNTIESNHDERFKAVASALDNKARPIRGSFRQIASYGNPAMVGFVEINREVKPFSESASKQMKVLSSNMFMDTSDDSLWELRSDASGNKMLARQQEDDLSSLLVTATVRGSRAPKMSQVVAAADRGDFVQFVDPVNAKMRYGYVLATDLEVEPAPVGGIELNEPGAEVLLSPDYFPPATPDNSSDEIREPGNRIAQRLEEQQTPVEWNRPVNTEGAMVIPMSLIVESAKLNGTDKREEVAAPVNSQSKEAMNDYYSKLYAYDPDYYRMVKEQIEQHASI